MASAPYLRSMRPLLRTTLTRDDRGPRALAAFSMLIGVYLVFRAIGLDPVPSLVSRLSGQAPGSTVVAAGPRVPSPIARRAPSAASSERGRAVRVGVPVRTPRTKRVHPLRPRTPIDRRPEAQPSSRGAVPKRDEPETQTPEIPPPPPPAHLPDPPAVPLPDPTAAVDPGTLTPPVALPVEPPLPNLPSVP